LKVTFMWPSNNSSRSNQCYYLMAPSKPYNFCLKHFFLKCIVYEIFNRSGTFSHHCIYVYTGYLILIAPGKYLKKYGRYGKMLQTKIVCLEGRQMMDICTWPWVTYWRSGQGHRCFFKRNPLFFIAYSCSSSRELSTIL